MWISHEAGLPLWVASNLWVMLAYAAGGIGMARWQERSPWAVELARAVMRRVAGAADLNQKEVAAVLDMRQSHVSRDLAYGGLYLAQIFALAGASEEVCAEARARIDRAFAQIADRHDERRRRLDAVRLEPVQCHSGSRSSRSSAA
jgi:predicted XRE-type DNA-binding protein